MKNKVRISGVILLIFMINSCEKNYDNVIKDIDGNVYNTVTIGTQVWMKENLKTTRYLNGDLIGTTTTATLDITDESAPRYQWAYYGIESFAATYGRLYTWFAVTDTRNVCPTGWHVSGDADWETLTTYLGDHYIAGSKLKQSGTIYWLSPNLGATNESGFTAFPGGNRYPTGSFNEIAFSGFWWTAEGSCRQMGCGFKDVYIGTCDKRYGLSVRCVKDVK